MAALRRVPGDRARPRRNAGRKARCRACSAADGSAIATLRAGSTAPRQSASDRESAAPGCWRLRRAAHRPRRRPRQGPGQGDRACPAVAPEATPAACRSCQGGSAAIREPRRQGARTPAASICHAARCARSPARPAATPDPARPASAGRDGAPPRRQCAAQPHAAASRAGSLRPPATQASNLSLLCHSNRQRPQPCRCHADKQSIVAAGYNAFTFPIAFECWSTHPHVGPPGPYPDDHRSTSLPGGRCVTGSRPRLRPRWQSAPWRRLPATPRPRTASPR